jgi:hypothetical protein
MGFTQFGAFYFCDTLEELGKGMDVCVEVEIDHDFELPEKQTWNYPGSPGGIYFCDCKVTEFSFTTNGGEELHTIKRDDRPDWFDLLDKIIAKRIEANWAEYEERIGEDLADYYTPY